jgi:SET domain-containing protein
MKKTIIKFTEEFGRGVYAEESISVGQWIELAEVLPLSEKDTQLVEQTDLKYYTFKFSENTDCIVLGNGEIYNHSDDANTSFDLINLNGRTMMLFKALKDINAGEQLFTNYNQDVTGITEKNEYSVNLLK